MKLIIDIPGVPFYRDMYTAICENGYIFDEDNEYIAKAIKNGTPIPDNATNGEVIKAMFPQWKFMENTFEEMVMFDIPMKDGYLEHNACSREWWNSPYQKGGRE